jgi:hypothetical protein
VSVPTYVGKDHQGPRASHLGFVWQKQVHRAREPDRLLGQIGPDQVDTAGARVPSGEVRSDVLVEVASEFGQAGYVAAPVMTLHCSYV